MRRRWWSGFDVIRRLMYIVVVTVVDFSYPDYTQVLAASNLKSLHSVSLTKELERELFPAMCITNKFRSHAIALKIIIL